MIFKPITLTSLDGHIEFTVIIRWEAVAWLRKTNPNATRPGTFIHFLANAPTLWVKQSAEEILSFLEPHDAP